MPATSKTIICNQAIAMIGYAGRIGDVDTENTPAANACRLFFEQIRDVVLETRPWPFATRRWSLQDIGVAGTLYEHEWAYRYKKPSDCILAVRLVNPFGRNINMLYEPFTGTTLTMKKPPFRIVDQETEYGDAILCDLDNAIMEGNYKVTDVNRFSASFNHALAMGIAAHVGMPLRVDPKIITNVQNQFSNWLAEASNLSQREQTDDPEQPSDLQSVRG